MKSYKRKSSIWGCAENSSAWKLHAVISAVDNFFDQLNQSTTTPFTVVCRPQKVLCGNHFSFHYTRIYWLVLEPLSWPSYVYIDRNHVIFVRTLKWAGEREREREREREYNQWAAGVSIITIIKGNEKVGDKNILWEASVQKQWSFYEIPSKSTEVKWIFCMTKTHCAKWTEKRKSKNKER